MSKDANPLKQRVIGATVVVALMVIFVPMLFDRQHPPPSPINQERPASALENGPETGGQVITLREQASVPRAPEVLPPLERDGEPSLSPGAGAVPQVPELPPPALPDAPAPTPSAPGKSTRSAPGPSVSAELTEKPGTQQAERASSAPMAQSTEGRFDSAAESERPDRSSSPAAAPAAKPPRVTSVPRLSSKSIARPAVPAGTTGQGRWVVQLGAFSNRTNANALVERLRRRGYTAFVQELNNGGTRLFRVRVGPRASREQAESLRMRIRREMPVEAQIRPY